MTKIIKLPIIICGELKYPEEDYISIDYYNNVQVRITRPTNEDLEKIYHYKAPLHDIPISKVTRYLSHFAQSFFNPENPIRKEAVELSTYVTGYSKEMLDRDYSIISAFLSQRFTSYEILEAELGSDKILDTWVKNKVARIRAFPRGRAFHILVGNVPLAGIYSIFRSILTKNQTIVKLPSRDIVSSLYFIKALIEANNDSQEYTTMISSSLSALYLKRNSKTIEDVISSSDMICAWGQGDSLKNIKTKVPYSIPYLEFGPKRSFSLVYTKNCDLNKAAIRMAHDLTVYDQEACLCPQRLFIIGEHTDYILLLQKWLNWQSKYLPRGVNNPDIESHIFRTKLEAKYRKWEIYESEPQWRIIIADPYLVAEHPLGRTLFVHLVKSEDDILPFIDDETQSISVYPYEDNIERLGDLFCAQGVARLCETGMSMYPREGWTHDGMYPLHYFIRMCCLDANMAEEYRYENAEGAKMFLKNMYGNPDENLHEFIEQFPIPT
jgi:long-chain-fatty-acyl-CoA reductase